MFAAVGEVDDEAEGHPDDETDPCVSGERDHHGEADESAEDGDDGDPRAAEDARGVGFFDAEDDDGDADEDEGEERADGAHFAPEFTWQDGDGEGGDAADEGVAFPWSLAARVEIREEAREETVAGHAEKDAALAHEEDHDDGGEAAEDGWDDELIEPMEFGWHGADGGGDGGEFFEAFERRVMGEACEDP